MDMPTILDSCDLTLSLREMENLNNPSETDPTSCLLDMDDGQGLDFDEEKESKTKISGETSLQELNRLSKTSETRKWPKSKLFIKSCELLKKQTLMNKSDKQPLMTMQHKSTSLMHSNVVPNNKVNMWLNWLESAMRELP